MLSLVRGGGREPGGSSSRTNHQGRARFVTKMNDRTSSSRLHCAASTRLGRNTPADPLCVVCVVSVLLPRSMFSRAVAE